MKRQARQSRHSSAMAATKPLVRYIRWNQSNLEFHHNKRTTVDAGCFEELLGIDPPPMSIDQYRQRSLETVVNSWAEYEAVGWNPRKRGYNENRAFYVDDDLVTSITNIERREFVTCFHEAHECGKHFDHRYHDNDRSEAAIGNRRLKYIRDFKAKVKGKAIKKCKALRGVPNV